MVDRVVYDFLPIDFNLLLEEHANCEEGKTLAMLEVRSITITMHLMMLLQKCNIGWCYLNGRGCPRDYKEATKWFSKHPKQNSSAGSQYNMG